MYEKQAPKNLAPIKLPQRTESQRLIEETRRVHIEILHPTEHRMSEAKSIRERIESLSEDETLSLEQTEELVRLSERLGQIEEGGMNGIESLQHVVQKAPLSEVIRIHREFNALSEEDMIRIAFPLLTRWREQVEDLQERAGEMSLCLLHDYQIYQHDYEKGRRICAAIDDTKRSLEQLPSHIRVMCSSLLGWSEVELRKSEAVARNDLDSAY